MNARRRLLVALLAGSVLFVGLAAARGANGDGGGLVDLIQGLIDLLELVLDAITGGGGSGS